MRRWLLSLLFAILSLVIAGFPQAAESPDPYKPVLDRLQSLTRMWEPAWRTHADIARPEEPSLDDSGWDTTVVAPPEAGKEQAGKENQPWSGTRVFRRWIEIPEKINGYATEGSRVTLDLRFVSLGILLPGNLRVTIFSNSTILYHGTDDNLRPVLLTGNAHPGQKFLVAARVVAEDQTQSVFSHSEITIEPPEKRPDPGFLRMETLAARTIIGAYEDGKAERQQLLNAAVSAIDLSALDKGDQEGFDASLRLAQKKLAPLKPWLRRFSIRAVGNAHIDMAWLWSWTETVEIVRNTFQSVLDLMREYPDFKFTMPSARAYEWMQDKYPDLFRQIQQRVKEGRWEIVGGMWVEPDLNMPAGESLVRQILIGTRYFKTNFGAETKIGWNPDSFGYNWQLPQIYKKSGIDYFVTQKLLWAHDFTTFPYKLFWWQSPDGSRLLTYFPHHYGGGIDGEALASDVSVWMPSIYGQNANDNPEMMHLYGVGDHGGGPTRTMLDHAAKLSLPGTVFPTFKFSLARDFFSDLEKRLPQLQVPTWNGELYFQNHRGVFTTQAETKRRIRRAEEQMLNAEKFASLATLYGRPYSQDDMELAWKDLLFDHFHDVMPGSGIAVNYLEAKRNLEGVGRVTGDITRASLREIAAHVNTEASGVPVMIFNSLSWPRSEVVEVEAQLPAPASHIVVVDSAGKPVDSQLLSIDPATYRARFLLLANTPALGYQTYFVRGSTTAARVNSSLKASARSLENEFLRVQIDQKSGCITSLVVKPDGTEVLAPAETDSGGPKDRICGNLLQAFVDKPRLMGIWNLDAWNIDADFEKHRWDLDQADEVKLIEAGPLRAIIRIKNHFQNSTFVRDVTLYAGVPRVDVIMQADWHEKHILLKVAFPLSAHNDMATFEIPYGAVQRPTTRNTPAEQAQFEVPALHWADLSNSGHGFSLLNDSKYGYDAKGNVLRLSLLRSPDFPDPHADEGQHRFTYSLYPHRGTWQEARTPFRGYELNEKLSVLELSKHQGSLPPGYAFVQVEPNNVIVTALKKSEADSALILRFYEWAGKETNVRLKLAETVRSAEETNLMEQSIKSVPIQAGSVVDIHTNPYEIKTVKLHF
jgi:alpha-mannosidase